MKILSIRDIIKLTIAPTAANKTVFKTSSECKLGSMLKKVPLAVLHKVELLTDILIIILRSKLADGR